MGFKVEETRREYLVGQFIHRREYMEEFPDPAGGVIRVPQVEVRTFRFRFQSKAPELEIQDPPRSLGTFVEFLGQALERDLVFDDVRVMPVHWLRALEGLTSRVTVLAMTTSGLALSASASALVHIDGTEDVRKHHAKFVGGNRGKIERLVCEFQPPESGRCELADGGRVTISRGTERTLEVVRDALRLAMETAAGE